jgi:tetratricopeptide (TPR) repeat protein
MIKRTLIFILLCSVFGFSFSQERTIDSLKTVLKTKVHDTTHCNILAQLVELEIDEDVWSSYNDQLKSRCETFLESCPADHPQKLFYLQHLAGALNNSGFLAQQKGDVPKALEYFTKSLNLRDQTGYKEGVAVCLSNIGVIYDNQGDIPKALEYYNKSLKIQEQIGDKKGMATTLNNLATVYDSQDEIKKAMEYYERSLNIHQNVGNKEGVGIAFNNIGFVYGKLNNIPKALDYFSKSFKIREEMGDKLGMSTTLNNLGRIHKLMGDTAQTLEDYTTSLRLSEEIGDKDGMSVALNNIAAILLLQGNWQKAHSLGERSLQISREIGYPQNIRDASLTLSLVHAKLGDWKKAFEMQVLYKQMDDSLNNQTNKKASIQKAFQYEYEKKAVADSIKTAEERKVHSAQMKEERTQRFALYGGLALVLGFSIFMFNRFRVTQKQKVIIEEQKLKVDHAYELLNEKNNEVMDSIRYAKRIQSSLLPRERYISNSLERIRKQTETDRT